MGLNNVTFGRRDDNEKKIQLLNFTGFNFDPCNEDFDLDNIFEEMNLSSFPINGYMTDAGGCVIVRLSD